MVKRFLFLLVTGFIFLQGCAMAAGKLVEEASTLEQPERPKPRQVDDIVKKYIAGGISKAKAKEILISEGFNVTEEMKKPLDDCVDCEGTVVVARYDHKPALSLTYDYGIVVEVGFRSGNVAVVHGWYVKNAY